MKAHEQAQSNDKIVAIISRIRSKNVRLWIEDGALRYKAPKGALTSQELEELKSYKEQVTASLSQSANDREIASEFRVTSTAEYFPLTHPQLAHWRANNLAARPSLRNLMLVLRFSGRLDISCLDQSLVETALRHDALRTQIVTIDGLPKQKVCRANSNYLQNGDLVRLPHNTKDSEIKRLLETYALEPVDVSRDALFSARLLRLNADVHVLALALEHLVSDRWSMNILHRELLEIYKCKSKGLAVSLSPISVQFSDFALWQNQQQNWWLQQHGKYWADRMHGGSRARFPTNPTRIKNVKTAWKSIPLELDSDVTAKLRKWCLATGTTLAMSVFCAYTALTLRWCSTSDAVIGYQILARLDPKVENTVGYFSSALFLRIQTSIGDRLIDLLRSVTQEYCSAYNHVDSGYLDAQVSELDFVRTTIFNWLPHEPGGNLDQILPLAGDLVSSPVPFAHPGSARYDLEPQVVFEDRGNKIVGSVSFPETRFQAEQMEKFSRNIVMFVVILSSLPETSLANIRLI